jgi:7-carboxy-7-deazaguanine synthase
MLKVNEIFFDIQDGTTFVGFPSIFISLAGKGVNHNYHSSGSNYSLKGEVSLTIEQILKEISRYNCYIVFITGGEPLFQSKIHSLISELTTKNYLVLVETSGIETIKTLNSKAIIILNIPAPSSINFSNFKFDNLNYLRTKDQIKFTLASSRDYNWAKELIFKQMLFEKCNILFYPEKSKLDYNTLAEWIISDQLPVRLGFNLKEIFKKN